jgi:hypothetical protein
MTNNFFTGRNVPEPTPNATFKHHTRSSEARNTPVTITSSMQMPSPQPTRDLVPPTAKDILIGRGHKVYNFIGNRRFRKLIDMFIQEYVESDSRNHKTCLVRKIIEIVLQSGYRFLSLDASGVFAEISYDEMKKKVSASMIACAVMLTRVHTGTSVGTNVDLLLRAFAYSFTLFHFLPKVGHSLRDRTELVAQHLALKLKTRDELAQDGIPLMDYVEMVTPSWHEHEITVYGLAHPRGSRCNNHVRKRHETTKKLAKQRIRTVHPSRDVVAASYLLNLSSNANQLNRRDGAIDGVSRTGEESMRINVSKSSISSGRNEEVLANDKVATRGAVHPNQGPTKHGTYGIQGKAANNICAHPTIENISNFARSQHEAIARTTLESSRQGNTRYLISLPDIVIPTLQKGHELLPVSGDWKFFPLPEFRKMKVDLGTQAKGWQLHLAPLPSQGESIRLNVPARFIVNGCQNPGQAGVDSI